MNNPYAKAFWAKLTPEQRSARASHAALARHKKLSKTQRKINSMKMTAARWPKKTA